MQHHLQRLIATGFVALAWWGAAGLEAQSRQQIAVDGTFDLRMASTGDVHVLVAQDARSGVAVFRSTSGGPFEPMEFALSDDPLGRRISGLWATTHGFFAFQRASRSAMPRLSRSVDGAVWNTINSPAFDAPADINDLVQLANGDLWAVGAFRGQGQPATGPLQGAMWRSRDGASWERVSIDAIGLAGATAFGSVATLGPRLVVAGQRNGSFIWQSDDNGASWALAGPAGELPVLATVAGRFLSFELPTPLGPPEFTYATSNDGREWQQGRAAALIDDGLSLFPRGAVRTATGAFLVGSTQLDLRRRLDWCYAAPTACARGSAALVVLHTATGNSWQRIDLDSLLGPGIRQIAVADTRTGTVVAGAREGAIEIVSVPTASWAFIAPESIPTPVGLPPRVPTDRTLEQGLTYREPLNVHCGLQWLGRFNGRTWKLARQLVGSPGSGRTLDLPQINQTVLGTVRLTSPDTIEYAIDGLGVVAIYSPTLEERPLCI